MLKPRWLRVKARYTDECQEVETLLDILNLHTVCKEANCPNQMECYSKKIATFMILGDVCTRNCTFCNVKKNQETKNVDQTEPRNIALAVKALGLHHVVVTSVTRDDLIDGGAGHFSKVISTIREENHNVVIEVLIPDFEGDHSAINEVVSATPHIINHNVETVPRLYAQVRSLAQYERSLHLLKTVKKLDSGIYTKSGIMVGLGESKEEVLQVMKDLRRVGCDFFTIGQYLAPSSKHHPVVSYTHPDIFKEYKKIGQSLGFAHVESGPLVRSSYQADKIEI